MAFCVSECCSKHSLPSVHEPWWEFKALDALKDLGLILETQSWSLSPVPQMSFITGTQHLSMDLILRLWECQCSTGGIPLLDSWTVMDVFSMVLSEEEQHWTWVCACFCFSPGWIRNTWRYTPCQGSLFLWLLNFKFYSFWIPSACTCIFTGANDFFFPWRLEFANALCNACVKFCGVLLGV